MKTLTTVTCTVFICAILFFGYLGYQQVNKKEQLEEERKGFNYKGQFITNPFISPCGRFGVNPKKYYGLTEEQVKQYMK